MSGLPPRSWAGGVTGGADVWASAEAGHSASKATRIGSARLAKRRRVAAFVDAVLRVIAIATARPVTPRRLRHEPPFCAHPGLGIARRTGGRRLVGE